MVQTRFDAAFPETRWSRVLRIRGDQRDASAQSALAELCDLYWYPLYAFARRSGHSPHDAEDLTQGFFTRLISQELFAKADPVKGRLRSFLLGSFRNFMSEQSRLKRREKRGGGEPPLSLDSTQAEAWLREPVSELSFETCFERDWANLLLRQALTQLEAEYRQRGRDEVFNVLRAFLAWNAGDAHIGESAARLGMSAGAVRVAIHRLRLRFRAILENHVAQTVASADDVRDELRHLLKVLETAEIAPASGQDEASNAAKAPGAKKPSLNA